MMRDHATDRLIPSIQNVVRRGTVYFRTEQRWTDSNLCRVFLSLNTYFQDKARRRANVLSVLGERLRVSFFTPRAH